MVSVDIICPVYKSFEQIKSLFESIKLQKDISVNKIVASLTTSDDEEEDKKIEEYFINNSIVFFKVNKDAYSHSLTREKMIREYCEEDIVVLLTQDVIFKDEHSILNLVKSIQEKETAYNYGKQEVKKNCIEKYIRKKNYPKKSHITEKRESMTVMDYFSSDSFSALDRDVFLKINGYQNKNLSMNEDQLFSYYLLENGYKKGYVAEAVVYHHHDYTLKDLKERYYQSGLFYKENNEFINIKTGRSGFGLSLYVFKEILIHFDIVSLFKFIPNMLARYNGFKAGKN